VKWYKLILPEKKLLEGLEIDGKKNSTSEFRNGLQEGVLCVSGRGADRLGAVCRHDFYTSPRSVWRIGPRHVRRLCSAQSHCMGCSGGLDRHSMLHRQWRSAILPHTFTVGIEFTRYNRLIYSVRPLACPYGTMFSL
jgi:hypothetical protein